jgi:PBP1b-binding outer membrane lipoprotein LpoB
MRRTLALALVLGGAMSLAGCSTTDNTNQANTNAGNPPRQGVVETNANLPANTNSNTVSSNTAVVTNNNGNKNTAGIKSINGNANTSNRNRKTP